MLKTLGPKMASGLRKHKAANFMNTRARLKMLKRLRQRTGTYAFYDFQHFLGAEFSYANMAHDINICFHCILFIINLY